MRAKDLKTGQAYFYQKGTASWRHTVNGDGAAYLLSTDTFVTPGSRHRENLPAYVREAEYSGRYDSRRHEKGLLAVTVRTNVFEGDIPKAVKDLLATMTYQQVELTGFDIPVHIQEALREHSCYAEVTLIRPQALLGEWDEIYTARKREAQARRKRETEIAEIKRGNAERWQSLEAQVSELLGGDVHLRAPGYGSDTRNERRTISIEALEKLVELADRARSLESLIDTRGTG